MRRKPRKPPHRLTRSEVLGIYFATGMGKTIAHRFDVALSQVTHIKGGQIHASITGPYRDGRILGAALITLACTGAA